MRQQVGWSGPTNAYRDFSIQSVPVAIGTAWRPAGGVTSVLHVDPKPNYCTYYVRYSPDKKHWSTWQALSPDQPEQVAVPGIARTEYDRLIQAYQRTDVPWKSDEEAAVKWILKQQPDFFEKHLPFVGYIQLRIEGSMPGETAIKSVHLELNWMVSGLHTIPKNRNFKEPDGPWRFESP